MSDYKKISTEQLQRIKDLQKQFDMLTKRFGELHYQKKLVDIELQNTEEAMDHFEAERKKTVQEITEELGSTGTIDLNTGEFIPDSQ